MTVFQLNWMGDKYSNGFTIVESRTSTSIEFSFVTLYAQFLVDVLSALQVKVEFIVAICTESPDIAL